MSTHELLVNRRRAAELLGVSERTLFDLTKKGIIPAIRLGKGRIVRYSVRVLESRIAELEAKGDTQ